MRLIIKILKKTIIGIGIGTVCYLWVNLYYHSPAIISLNNTIDVTIMSALIGIYTLVFDNDKLNYLTAFLTHMFLSLITVLFFFKDVIHGMNLIKIIEIFLILYALIWLLIRFMKGIDINKMNKAIQKNRNKD